MPYKKMGTSGQLPSDKWEKTLEQVEVAGGRYCPSEMGAPEELRESVDKLSSYVKSNREKR